VRRKVKEKSAKAQQLSLSEAFCTQTKQALIGGAVKSEQEEEEHSTTSSLEAESSPFFEVVFPLKEQREERRG